ncbi:MAG: hypothetical protein ACE5F1_06230 [Planctomycetota bacterium]
MRIPSLSLAIGVLAGAAAAQVSPGEYIATVRSGVTNGFTGHIVYVHPARRTVTQVTISDPQLIKDVPNCITMLNPVLGFIGSTGAAGTNVTPVTGNVYRAVFSGAKVTVTKLNTAAHGGYNVAQIVIAGGSLYYTTADKTSTSGFWNGFLYSLPQTGGAPTQLVDFSKVTGFPASHAPNALATNGTSKVWIFVWSTGPIYEYDIAQKTIKQIGTLPNSKRSATTVFYPLHAVNKTATVVAVGGLYGDVVELDMTQAPPKVLNQYYDPKPTGTGLSPYINSIALNTDSGDYIKGTRDGAVDITVPQGTGQTATRFVRGLGSAATPSQNSVSGMYYRPGSGGSHPAFDAGGKGSGSFILTSVSCGDPTRSSANFGFGMGGAIGGNAVLLLVGASKVKIDMTTAGAPGQFLYTLPSIVLPAVATGSGNGQGVAAIGVPLPPYLLQVVTQWAAIDPVNTLKLVFSDGRMLKT